MRNHFSFYVLLMLSCSCFPINVSGLEKSLESQKKIIRKIFLDWQLKEIQAHHFWAKDSCNSEFFSKHEVKETGVEWGIPDSSEIKFSFADINRDGRLDGLATFTPDQCDGGNGSMWTQIQILIVSDKKKYNIKKGDCISTSFYVPNEKGFYWLDSIAPNRLLGIYYQFKDGDGRCCPSIQKKIAIFYNSRKMKFVKDKNRKTVKK